MGWGGCDLYSPVPIEVTALCTGCALPTPDTGQRRAGEGLRASEGGGCVCVRGCVCEGGGCEGGGCEGGE